jgi:ATPase subunit of ABC transporter with duplicated ATPase domains
MKRRAQVTTAKIDVATLDKANESMRAAFEAYQDLKLNPIMYAEISGSPVPNQKLIVETREFNIRYKDWLFKKDLTFLWRGNIRLALKGKNGSGKSSLLKAILNQSPAEFRGEIRRGNLKTLYIDQRGERLDDDLSVLENVRQNSLLDEGEVRNQLAQFLFTKETVFQKAASLSGGERLRASLAKGLLATEKPELLILDEPTNNLDLKNIEFLEELAREFKGALIVISHDEVFLENCNLNEVYNVDF